LLYRAPIDDGGALAMETARFRDIYNRIRPHQSLGDRTPRDAYLGITGEASVYGTVTETQHRAGLTGPCALGGSAAVLDARRVPVTVPFRTQHPLGAVVNRPSVRSDR